jgi:hypothetical protein
MDIPDFQITTLPIVRQLLIDVAPSARGQPNFDDQRKRLRVRIEASGLLEKCLHDWGRNHGDVRDVVGVGGSPQARVVGANLKFVSIDLIEEPLHQKHHDTAVLDAHPRLFP